MEPDFFQLESGRDLFCVDLEDIGPTSLEGRIKVFPSCITPEKMFGLHFTMVCPSLTRQREDTWSSTWTGNRCGSDRVLCRPWKAAFPVIKQAGAFLDSPCLMSTSAKIPCTALLVPKSVIRRSYSVDKYYKSVMLFITMHFSRGSLASCSSCFEPFGLL